MGVAELADGNLQAPAGRRPRSCAVLCLPCVVAWAVMLWVHQTLPSPCAGAANGPRAPSPPEPRLVRFLAWTTVFGRQLEPETRHCGDGLWYTLTSDRSALAQADALLFHAQDYSPASVPRSRDPLQPWILRSMESPVSDRGRVDRCSERVRVFNMTSTYERESVGWVPYAPNDLRRLLTPVVPTRLRKQSAPIVWVAMNCAASNRRQEFIKELMRHVRIDSFGSCLRNAQWNHRQLGRGGNFTAFKEFLRGYKFYLAFENSDCDDYVTEKYWRALEMGNVPIVLGAPNIDKYAPTNRSIIKVTDFDSVQALAAYINMLDRDDAKYEEYLAYKDTASTRRPLRDVLRPEFLRMFRRTRSECALAQGVLRARQALLSGAGPTVAQPQRPCLAEPSWTKLRL
eukprot:m51a1_g5283 hypothetical protein (400) ;mRNA; r:178215-179788